jgi:branched-chain amino acid transport system substrate-binding protein
MRVRKAIGLAFVAMLATAIAAVAATAAQKPAQAAPKPAKGTPFVIGFTNTEDVPGLSFQNLRYGAEAAVKWVNAERGGIGGRPLQLKECTLNATVAGSAACANTLAQAHVPLVVNGVDVAAGGAVPVYQSAGIPYSSVVPVGPAEYTSPFAHHFFSGSTGTYPALAYYMATILKAKRVALAYTDNAAGASAADLFAVPVLKKFGVTDVVKVPIAAAAADFTAPMSAIGKDDPNGIMVLASAQFCLRSAQARQSLGLKIPMFYSSGCFEQDTLDAGGSAFKGGFFPTSAQPFTDLTNADVTTFRAKLAKYGAQGVSPSGYTQIGFSEIVTIANLLNTLSTSRRTGAGIQARFQSLVNFPVFMAHSATCDGKQIEGFPAICNPYVRMVQLYNGKVVPLLKGKWISGLKISD